MNNIKILMLIVLLNSYCNLKINEAQKDIEFLQRESSNKEFGTSVKIDESGHNIRLIFNTNNLFQITQPAAIVYLKYRTEGELLYFNLNDVMWDIKLLIYVKYNEFNIDSSNIKIDHYTSDSLCRSTITMISNPYEINLKFPFTKKTYTNTFFWQVLYPSDYFYDPPCPFIWRYY